MLRRAVLVAERSGDREQLKLWTDALKDAKEKRSSRLRVLPELLAGLVRATAAGLALLVLLLVALAPVVVLLVGRLLGWLHWRWLRDAIAHP